MRCSPLVMMLGLGLAASCVTDDNSFVQLGRLDVEGRTHIAVPDTVDTAQDFEIEIQTYGSSCLTTESTDVVMTAEGATVSVYDRDPGGNCTADIAPIEHHATLSFDTVGAKVITVHGANVQGTPADYRVNVDVN